MTRIEGVNDPVARSVGTFPIRYFESVMEGSRPFCKAYVPDNGPMTIRQEQGKSDARRLLPAEAPTILRLDPPTFDYPECRRMPDKKQCFRCGRGTHLQFAFGEFLKLRVCRRSLTGPEKAALFMMLTEAEAGGLTD
jgi:hypothetical protein